MLGSSRRRDPAAALRGLAKRGRPCSSRSANQAIEGLAVHDHLAAHFERLGSRSTRRGRERIVRGVFGDVFARRAVAAGHGLRE